MDGISMTLFVISFSHLTVCTEMQITRHFSVDFHAYCLAVSHQISM